MRRRLLIAVAVLGLGIVALAVVLAAAGAFHTSSGKDSIAAAHQTVDASMTEQQATDSELPQATRAQENPILSCPRDGMPPAGIFPRDPAHQPPGGFHGEVRNTAVAIGSNGLTYRIVAGSLAPYGEYWVIDVTFVGADLCATRHALAPSGKGGAYKVGSPVTLTQIDGDAIVFVSDDGTVGRLNYVTGTFEGVPN